MVRELEVKKNGRRRAAASGLINFSTLSKFFFPFRRHLCSSMKKGICSSNGMLSLPSHLSRKFYSGFIIHVWNFLLFLNWKEHFVTYFFFSLTSRRIGSLSSSACFFYFQKLFLMSSELIMAGDIHSSTFRIHKTSMKCALHIFLKYFMDCLENNLSRNFSTFLGYKKIKFSLFLLSFTSCPLQHNLSSFKCARE